MVNCKENCIHYDNGFCWEAGFEEDPIILVDIEICEKYKPRSDKDTHKKIKFTFRPNQNTKRCFWYYESEVQIPEVEEKLKELIKKRGYGESHTNIIKFKSKVRGNEYIILEE